MRGTTRLACLAVALLFILALCGCWVPSLNPLFEDSDLIYDHGLEGLWVSDSGDASMTFSRSPDAKCYDIAYSEKVNRDDGGPARAEKTNFTGCLARFGRSTLLDIMPSGERFTGAEGAHLMPVHSFWRIDVGLDNLSLQTLNESWFNDLAAKKKLRLAYVRQENNIVLTASTPALKAFFKRYSDSDEIFDSKKEFHRQK